MDAPILVLEKARQKASLRHALFQAPYRSREFELIMHCWPKA
jgi:hypothetical protein